MMIFVCNDSEDHETWKCHLRCLKYLQSTQYLHFIFLVLRFGLTLTFKLVYLVQLILFNLLRV